MKNYKVFRHTIENYYKADKKDALAKKHIAWETLNNKDKESLKLVFELKDVNLKELKTTIQEKYWSKSSPIDFRKYPYIKSSVYIHEKTGNLFLVYREFGGHVPELRARLIQKKLVKFAAEEEE